MVFSEIVLPEFGSLVWPVEEATFLCLIKKRRQLYEELMAFLQYFCFQRQLVYSSDLLEDLVLFQQSALVDPFSPIEFSVVFNYDFNDYFRNAYVSNLTSLRRIRNRLYFTNGAAGVGDLERTVFYNLAVHFNQFIF